jgi:acetyltransferase-like isoleucine patch superfamily enzyme
MRALGARNRAPDLRVYDEEGGRASLRSLAKLLANAVARILVFPAACLAGFGRWREPYQFFAHTMALMPGLPGNYLRAAYYFFTLNSVGRNCHIAFGSFFAHSNASIGDHVGIGAYCVLGRVDIGEGSLLAGHVQVLSGQRQHQRDEAGHLTDEGRVFRRISIGAHCWIGAGAIVAADVGAKATVGPGSVVAQDVPEGATVSGNPARNFSVVLKPLS